MLGSFWTRIAGSCRTSSTRLKKMATLETLNFDNLALRSLPVDPEEENYPRRVSGACFSRVRPTPVDDPELVAYSAGALALLGLALSEVSRPDFAQYFSGNRLLPGSRPAAHCYCGHQFGYFVGQLGDGAAMYLGEIVNSSNERWEMQLKGAGLTPYSRQADGRKVLRSSIREFLCSEALHHLGIPTTRAGTCVTSSSTVLRDMFYDGNPIHEKCTIVLRIAPTFIRFGSFEIFKPTDTASARAGPSCGQTGLLLQLLDYVVKTFYFQIWDAHNANKQIMYLEFFKEVVKRTARLVVEWQCVGWCHGVLNTDNMSILGLTIDYGPFGFMDTFDPDFICNSSDDGGRYTYAKQPEICWWNCKKLAEALQDAVPLTLTEPELKLFDEEFQKCYQSKMRKKFGLQKEMSEDDELFSSFLDVMRETGADFTNSFRCLSHVPLSGTSDSMQESRDEVMKYLLSQCSTVEDLKHICKPRMDPRQLQIMIALAQTNPDLVAQLGRGFHSIYKELERQEKIKLLQDLTEEEKIKTDRQKWAMWLTKYENRLKKEVEEISDMETLNQQRIKIMNSNNPRFILRNYIAQNVIKAAEKGDYSEVKQVLRLLENPYSDHIDLGELASSVTHDTGAANAMENDDNTGPSVVKLSAATRISSDSCSVLAYDSRPPAWAADLQVS